MAQSASPGVQATQNQVGTQDQRNKANESFGAFLDRELDATVQRALGLKAPSPASAALAASIKQSVRASVGGTFGVHGGISAGGVGGTAGGGANISAGSSLELGAKATFGASAGASAGVSAALAGGTSGNVSGVPTGPTSLGAKLGTKPSITASFAGAPRPAIPAVQAGSKEAISASVMAALSASMAGAGFSSSETAEMSARLAPGVDDSVSKPIDSAYEDQDSYPTANGAPILGVRIVMQERGKWTGTFRIDAPDEESEPPSGPIVVNVNGVEYRGTVVPDRTGSWAGAHKVRVVGGAGGLDVTYGVRNYANGAVLFSTVFNDVLRDSGEVASDECDKAILNAGLPGWHRSRGTAAQSLNELCDKVGCQWRVLRDGTVWVGIDQWPEVEPSGTVMHEMHDEGVVRVSPDFATLVPGVIVRGQKIKKVVHVIDEHDPNGSLKSDCYARSEQDLFQKILDKVQRRNEYSYRYWCTISRVNADGTVDVDPDDPRMKGNGVGKCRLLAGLPNANLVRLEGARCLLGFVNGDPSQAYVSDFDQGAPGGTNFGSQKRGLAPVGGTVKILFPPVMPFQGTVAGAPAAGVLTIVDAGIGVIETGVEDPTG